MFLIADKAARVHLDLSTRVKIMESGGASVKEAEFHSGQNRPIPASSLALIDWQRVYLELLEYKGKQGMEKFCPDTGNSQKDYDGQRTRETVQLERGGLDHRTTFLCRYGTLARGGGLHTEKVY